MIVNTMSQGVSLEILCQQIYYAKSKPKLIQAFSPFTFTDVSVEVDCVDFALTSSFASAASVADMHSKLHRVLKRERR